VSTVIPVEQLGRRMPEAGRIRLGVRGRSGAPSGIDTLRFTSPNESAIRELAALYGGSARPWNPRGDRHEWEVITEALEVPIVLPPDPLSGPVYELWSGGGIVRRCDGTTATVSTRTGDGGEPGQVPCVCFARQRLECSVKTRLMVVLTEIRFGGVWRLETSSSFAARELPGMVDAIAALQSQGFARATLTRERRTQVKNGQTRHFLVPVLRTNYTPDEIVEGSAHLAALATPPKLGLPAPPLLDPEIFDADSEVVEAEVVDDLPQPRTDPQRIAIRCSYLGLDDDARHGFAYAVSNGRTSSTKELDDDEIQRIFKVLDRLDRGEVEFTGVVEGRSTIRRKEPA
jgi:Recombination directionality factor-like